MSAPNLFVARREDNPAIITSPDGVTWTFRNALDNVILALYWDGITQLLIATTNSSGPGSVMTSPDAINWTRRASAPNGSFRTISRVGTRLVANRQSDGAPDIYSSDGINWTSTAANAALDTIAIASSGTRAVAVAFGTESRYTDDGLTWTTSSGALTSDPLWGFARSITWFKNRFWAMSGGGLMISSSDGNTWADEGFVTGSNEQSSGLFDFLWANGNTELWACRSNATPRIYKSTNGTTWTSISGIAGTGSTTRAAYSGSEYAIIGTDRAVTSPDGVTWTSRTSGGGNWTDLYWAGANPQGGAILLPRLTYNAGQFRTGSLVGSLRLLTVIGGRPPEGPRFWTGYRGTREVS